MKNLICFLFLLLLAAACVPKDNNDYSHPQKVIVAGKVLNHNSGNQTVTLSVNRLGLKQEQLYSEINDDGSFHAEFEVYIPTDVWVLYKTNFLALVHPGDSIYIEFDGNINNRPEILETIKFSGDAAKENQQAARFQQMYFSNSLYSDWNAKSKAVKEYDTEQYLAYLDTVRMRGREIYDSFVKEVSPIQEVKDWALTHVEEDYYDYLAFYPDDHRRENGLTREEWDVPTDFNDRLLQRLPIEKSMLISGYAISNFINRFHYDYVRPKTFSDEGVDKVIQIFPGGYAGSPHIMDSLRVYGIIRHTPDTLLRQMVLTEYFSQNIEKNDIEPVERNRDVIDKYITAPFLKEPLLDRYEQVKFFLENPQIASDAVLKEISDSKAGEIMDEIMAANKGKVIYIDFWGTWCGPCIAEMPNSKRLMKELEDKDIAFVYVCIDSQEENWKAKIAELELGGQHYFLTPQQSADTRKIFKISGIPYYMLIDKNGAIVDKGSHIRPGSSKQKIEALL